jgi:histone H3/H4
MQHQQQQQPARPKLEDSKRIQLVLDEINAKYADRKNGNQRIFMDEKAKQMFLDYANELTISVLEASNMLAQHRNSKTIEIADVNMVLGKNVLSASA